VSSERLSLRKGMKKGDLGKDVGATFSCPHFTKKRSSFSDGRGGKQSLRRERENLWQVKRTPRSQYPLALNEGYTVLEKELKRKNAAWEGQGVCPSREWKRCFTAQELKAPQEVVEVQAEGGCWHERDRCG